MPAYKLKPRYPIPISVPRAVPIKLTVNDMEMRARWERANDPVAWTRRINMAFNQGRDQGLSDLHTTNLNYFTSEEWLEHLRGWRAGQAEIIKRYQESQ